MTIASATPAASYALGHTEAERRRLALQSSMINPVTEQLLQRAGIACGMRILDLGCGIGDVSLIAARLVGRHGQVTGIDADGPALETATRRANGQNLQNVHFVRSMIDDYAPDVEYDAVIGRLILVHTREPQAVVRRVASMLRRGGVAAFHEPDFSVVLPAPTTQRVAEFWGLVQTIFTRAGTLDVGSRLVSLFRHAGLTPMDCRLEIPVICGADDSYYELVAETWISLRPHAQAMGLPVPPESDAQQLAAALRNEICAPDARVPTSAMVAGIARKA